MTKCQWAIPCSNEAKQGGYCDTHNRALGIKPEKVKKVTPIKKVSDKQKEKIKADKPRKDALNKFFAEMAAIMPNACQECGCSLKPSLLIHPRSTICHVLPKRFFDSVATDKENILFLCIDCHHKADTKGWDTLNIFTIARDRVMNLLPKITDKEAKHLPEYFI